MSSSINYPKVSIVITTYNRCQLLARALETIIYQCYPTDLLEVIVIDDCSTDNTPNYLDKISKQPSNIRVLRNNSNVGQTISLIRAIESSTGDLIGWVDDDDFLHPDCIRLCVEQFLNTKIDLVYTDYFVCNLKGQNFGKGSRCKIDYTPDVLLTSFVTFHFRLFRRSIYQRVGGLNPNFLKAQDYDFCLKVSEVGKIQHLKIPLYYYTIHLDSASFANVGQIVYSYHAIIHAIQRRGLTEKYNLLVNPQFVLCEK